MEISEKAKFFYKKAEKCIKNQEYEKALINLNLALNIEPNNVIFLSDLAYVHYKLNFKEKCEEEVIKILKKALELYPNFVDALYNMGIIFNSKKD